MQLNLPDANIHLQTKSDKDNIIAQLRNELYDLRHVVKEFGNLNAQLENLQGKYDLLLEERDRNERDQKIKAEIDHAGIEQLRNQLDQLNHQLDNANGQHQNLDMNNSAMRRILQARQKEIDHVKRENLAIKSKLQKKRTDVASKFSSVRTLKEEKNKAEDELMNQRQKVDQNILKAKKLEREIKAKQTQGLRQQKKVFTMSGTAEQIRQQLQKQTEQLRKNITKLSTLQTTFEQMLQQLKELEQLKEKRRMEANEAKENYEVQAKKNKEIQARLTKLEGQIKYKEREIDELLKKRNHQMQQQQKQSEYNQSLNGKLDKNIEIILEYQSINQEVDIHVTQLVSEIRAYCHTDQKARELFDRTGRMEQVIGRVERKLKNSYGPISHILRR